MALLGGDSTIVGDGNKNVGRDDNSTTNNIYNSKATKLSSLFAKLKQNYKDDKVVEGICDNLKKFTGESRDKIGLEEKLERADLMYLYEDAAYLKEEYNKKLTKYQFYEPAQEIHAFILAIICEKFRYLIYPLLKTGQSTEIINATISKEIIQPIITLINEEGCDDIMGLTSDDVEGMMYHLTGNCHIRWKL